MKVTGLTQSFQRTHLVRDKKDADENSRDQQQKKGQDRDDDNPPSKDPREFETEVNAAVQAFGADSQAQAHGLSVNQIGSGPGLKVILRDGSGAVVRQFTGEEFLKLRAAATEGQLRGKLLDRKF